MNARWDAWDRMAARQHRHAVPHDRFDEQSWVEARKEMPSLQDLYLDFTARFDCAPEFLQDFFLLLLKGDPRVRPAGEMMPAYLPNRQMVERFSTYDELLNLREHTANHLYATMLAMLSMRSELEAAFEAMELARQMAEELQQRMDMARDLAERARELIENADPADAQELADIELALEELLGTLVALEGQALEAADIAAGQVMLVLRAGAAAAGADLDASAALAHQFGLSPGQLQRKSFAERQALMERLNHNRIKKFASLIGAMREAAEAALRKRVRGVPSEIVGVELGDDLGRLTPDELISLATPELEVDFLMRFLERRLHVYAVRGAEHAGHGPLIVVCDESGSMTIEDIGSVSREAWSKALTLALARLAQATHRPMLYIGFASSTEQWMIDMSAPGVDPVIEMTEHFFAGGTSFEEPLMMALAECRTRYDARKYGQADIVFITDDGYVWVDDEWRDGFNAERRRLGVRVHGVLIGYEVEPTSTMSDICDGVRPISGILPGSEVDAGAALFSAAI